jgi:hypothetical protein
MPAPHPARLLKKPSTGQFDFPTTLAGTSADGLTTVYYDPSLGQGGADLATALIAAASGLNTDCSTWFGIPCQPVNLIIADLGSGGTGDGGAYHYGCDFATGGDIYIDAATGNPDMDEGLYVAELTECFMGTQNLGWSCGASNGEALSRWLAENVSGGPGGALAAFATAPAWDQAGRPNWIDQTESTDQDDIATGCGVVYLSWMISLGQSLAQLVQAGGATFADNYQALTGKTTAWADLTAALAGVTISDDDPFAGAAPQPQPQPPPPPAPSPAPPPPAPNGTITQDQAIAALTALVRASTLPT